MSQKTYIFLLIVILLIALIPRLWLWNDQGRAGMIYPGDQDEYYRGAIHLLLQGDYYDDGQWLRPPLTSLFLAAIFAVVGVHVPMAMLIQCLLSIATLPLLAELAHRVLTSRRAALAAALIGALFLPYASYASQLLSETLFIFTITLALLIFEIARAHHMDWRWVCAGGIAWALATLTRPVGLYALPLLVVWIAWVKIVHRPRTADGKSFRISFVIVPLLAFILGFVLVIAPWTIRNYVVYHHFVIVDTNGGVSFWLGNLLTPEERELQGEWNRTISNSAERQKIATARAIENIKREPLTFLSRLRYKTVSLWQLDTRLFVANAPIGITLDEQSLPFAIASDMQYVLIMGLAVFGLVLALPSERSWTLIGWIIYGTLLSAVSLGHPRLRLPLLIPIFVYAALPLAHPRLIWKQLKQSSWYYSIALAIGLGVLAFLFYAHVYLSFARGMYWLIQAQCGGGVSAIERAIQAIPNSYLPYASLGALHRREGHMQEALTAYEQATRLAPQNSALHLQMLDLYRHMGDNTHARAAMEAVAVVGWDNNQTYAWAWENIPATVQDHLDGEAPAPGIMRGFYAVAYDGGRPFRWTMEKAQIRFAAPKSVQETTLVLVLRTDQHNMPVHISIDDRALATVQVGTDWQHIEIPLPSQLLLQDMVVTLQSPTYVVSPAEPYPRGVALAEAWIGKK